jgi:hypothetical protein
VTSRRRPVPRVRVLAGALGTVVALFALAALTEFLRHPLPEDAPRVPELDEPSGDPRAEIACAEAAPREGEQRAQQPVERIDVVTSNELYDCPQLYDGQVVRYRGEVVGAVLRRDGGAWVQLNDDVYAETLGPLPSHRDYRGGNAGVGAFIPPELVDDIRFVGGPQFEGDVLEIAGTFHRVDPRTNEVAIIQAERGTVAVRGKPFLDPPLADRRLVAALLVPLALGFVVAERVVARRR